MKWPTFGCSLRRRAPRLILAGSILAATALPAAGGTIYANPGDSINSKISTMSPGDTLILNPGTYNPSGTVIRITSKSGTPTAWYTIKAMEPGTVKIQGNSGTNMCELRNSAYWRFQNLELDGRYLADDGIKATVNTGVPDTDWCHDIIIDNVHMHNLNNACVNTQVTVWNLTVQNCWLHDTGLAGYLGSPDHVQQIINLVWQHNLIERTGGYGMQVKAQDVRTGLTLGTTTGLEFTSWGWLIKDNVYMRTSPPAVTGRPCLLVDAAPASGVGSTDLATIEGNVVLAQTADATSDNAFQLSGNLRVINNILMNCKASPAIRIGFHDITYPRWVEVINNTVFTDGSSYAPCLAVSSLQSGYTQIIANNAFIRGDTSALAVSASVLPGTIVTNNIVRGTGAIAGMTTITTPVSQIFSSTTDVPGTANFYPVAGSPLIDAGSNTYATAYDFNRISRPYLTTADVGAYEVHGATNPGWQLAIDFKRIYGDVNLDSAVDAADLLLVADSFGLSTGNPGFDSRCDFNGSGTVDISDVLILAGTFGT
jgi:hypothetical protein